MKFFENEIKNDVKGVFGANIYVEIDHFQDHKFLNKKVKKSIQRKKNITGKQKNDNNKNTKQKTAKMGSAISKNSYLFYCFLRRNWLLVFEIENFK